jgi:hypothetical protein
MPARIVVAHTDSEFLSDTLCGLRSSGYDAVGFSDSNAALAALEAAERVEILVTRVVFAQGTPHGVALAQMARLRRRGIKVLFIVRPELVSHTEGVGTALLMPVTPGEVVAKVIEMLGETDSDAGASRTDD